MVSQSSSHARISSFCRPFHLRYVVSAILRRTVINRAALEYGPDSFGGRRSKSKFKRGFNPYSTASQVVDMMLLFGDASGTLFDDRVGIDSIPRFRVTSSGCPRARSVGPTPGGGERALGML